MKSYKLILAAAVTAGSAAVCNAQVQELNTFIYSNTDPFIKSFSADLSAAAAQKNIKLNLYNANQDLLLQVDQMEEAAASNPAPMLVNPVDPNQGQKALEIAKSRHLPIIFFNRFPSFKDMSSYDQAWYVGADPYQAGALQADILQQWMQQHAWDRNSDGKLQLVILKGPENHPDTAGRTDALASSLFTQGIEVNVLAELNSRVYQ